MEPIVTLEDLRGQPQPVTMLFELCQKHGKHVDIKHWRDERKSIASVYVDGQFVASGSSEHKEFAKLDAAKVALDKLGPSMSVNAESFEGVVFMDGSFHIEEAKQKLHEICDQKKWPKPMYKYESLRYHDFSVAILFVKQSHIGFPVAALRKMKVVHMRRDLSPQLKLRLWMGCYT